MSELTREAVIDWVAANMDAEHERSLANVGVKRREEPTKKFRRRMWDKIDNDTYDDEPIVLNVDEFGRLCSLMDAYLQSTVPSPEREETHRIISEAAKLIEKPRDGETLFTIRVCDDVTHLHTKAGKGVIPAMALAKAIDALRAEAGDAEQCPAHRKVST